MPIVRASDALILEDSAVSLARYAQIIGYSECAFFGVKAPRDTEYACRTIWTLDERRTIAKYLAEAQGEIEDVLHYPLAPKWIENEQHDLRCPVVTTWGRVIEAGVRAESVIEAGAIVDHADDPAIVAVSTSITDVDEIRIYHPGTDAEIHPSAIEIAGGVATIEIPRCRMVAEDVANNPPEGLEYDDPANFESTVDVKRVYNDTSTNATLVGRSCASGCTCGGCTETTASACMYVAKPLIGAVIVKEATYSGSAWVPGSGICRPYNQVRLNYRAGLTRLTYQMEDAIVRLAHAKMPSEPCACDVAKLVWTRDRNTPEILTRERLNSPFGMSDGAWTAYRFAQAKRLVRASVL